MQVIPDEIDKLFERLEKEGERKVGEDDDIAEIELFNGNYARSDDPRLVKLNSGEYALLDDNEVFQFDNKWWCIYDEDIAIDYRTGEHTYSSDLNWGYIDSREENMFSEGIYVQATNSYYLNEEVLKLHGYQLVNGIAQIIPNDNLKEFEAILQSVYPDKWEIKNSNRTISTCYIHFPEIVITNSNNNSHLIRDLYVNFEFISSTLKFRHNTFNGFRTTVTQSELNSNYSHSHLHSLVNTHFCMGSGPIAFLTNDLYSAYKPEIFEAFLLSLNEYLKWESIEGTPYKYLEKINNLDQITDIVSNEGVFNGFQEFINQLTEFNLKVTDVGVRVLEPDFQDIEEKLTAFAIKNNYTALLVRKDIDTNRYFVDRAVSIGNSFDIPITQFKGKTLEKKIIKEEEQTKLPLYAHPKFTNYICSRIKQEINKFYFNDRNASEGKTPNI